MKITKDIFIEDLVKELPEAVRLLMKYGIVCIACGEPVWGTLEENARKKGIKNLDEILEKLNNLKKEKTDGKNI